jgi:hypothetical protein
MAVLMRPYIPVTVRLRAAELQAENAGTRISTQWWSHYDAVRRSWSDTKRLYWVLEALFGGKDVQLDHDPALELRKRRGNGGYVPDANNPRFLVYRTIADHRQKTTGRKPDAERTVTAKGSDLWLAKKFRKLEQPKKSKSRIPSRPFPKSRRPLRSRSSFATNAREGS